MITYLLTYIAVCSETYFDTLNRLGVNHECNRQTDRQTANRTAFCNSAV